MNGARHPKSWLMQMAKWIKKTTKMYACTPVHPYYLTKITDITIYHIGRPQKIHDPI